MPVNSKKENRSSTHTISINTNRIINFREILQLLVPMLLGAWAPHYKQKPYHNGIAKFTIMVYCAFFQAHCLWLKCWFGERPIPWCWFQHGPPTTQIIPWCLQVPLLKSVYHRGYGSGFPEGPRQKNLVAGCMKKGQLNRHTEKEIWQVTVIPWTSVCWYHMHTHAQTHTCNKNFSPRGSFTKTEWAHYRPENSYYEHSQYNELIW